MKERITAQLVAATGPLAFFKFAVLPDLNLLMWVFITMLFDFATGVLKAVVKQEMRTSSGYRKTAVKFVQYGGAIIVGIILSNALPQGNILAGYVNDALLVLLIYIETTSICENIYAIDSSSMFSRFFIAPLLRILTIAIRRTPLNQAASEE